MATRIGGIVLAGGRSHRMGVAKATLPFGPETLLQRVVRIVAEATSPVVVVAAPGQDLPALPPQVILARDQIPDRGPLEGIAAGLRALPTVDAVFISACDSPLLSPAFVRRMIELLDADHDAAVPVVGDLPQPLAGVYRPSVLSTVDQMLAENRRRVLDLLVRVRTRHVLPDELRDIDPDLQSLRNLNTPADYEAALAAAGLAGQNRG